MSLVALVIGGVFVGSLLVFLLGWLIAEIALDDEPPGAGR